MGDQEEDSMVILHKYVPAWGAPDLSPFCFKVETYLRMAGVPFTARVADVRKAPKQKLPYVEVDGTTVCDSRDIIRHFEETLESPLDSKLSAGDKALSRAFRALLEEEAYFYTLVLRWAMDDGWQTYKPVISHYLTEIGIPRFLAPIIAGTVRGKVRTAALAQGAGRHSREQVDDRLLECFEAVVTQLGTRSFFLGDTPRVIDATVYAFVSATVSAPFPSKAKQMLQASKEVARYCAHMEQRYYAQPSDKPLRAARVEAVVGHAP